jgi:hypothetical protein
MTKGIISRSRRISRSGDLFLLPWEVSLRFWKLVTFYRLSSEEEEKHLLPHNGHQPNDSQNNHKKTRVFIQLSIINLIL